VARTRQLSRDYSREGGAASIIRLRDVTGCCRFRPPLQVKRNQLLVGLRLSARAEIDRTCNPQTEAGPRWRDWPMLQWMGTSNQTSLNAGAEFAIVRYLKRTRTDENGDRTTGWQIPCGSVVAELEIGVCMWAIALLLRSLEESSIGPRAPARHPFNQRHSMTKATVTAAA
jgi:hypothetical protein